MNAVSTVSLDRECWFLMLFKEGSLSPFFSVPFTIASSTEATICLYLGVPDLSLIVKARSDGANYLHALLTGYVEAPSEKKVPDGMYYNKYYSGKLIGMPQPLYLSLIHI